MQGRWGGVLAAAMVAAAPLAAQNGSGPVQGVDKIAAVVGRQPIMLSMVEEQFFTFATQGGAASLKSAADSARVRRQILEDLVEDELLFQEAQRDTAIVVSDQEISEQVDGNLRDVRKRFTDEATFMSELGTAGFATLDEYRRFLTEQAR